MDFAVFRLCGQDGVMGVSIGRDAVLDRGRPWAVER